MEGPDETIDGFLTSSRAVAPSSGAWDDSSLEYELYGPLDPDEDTRKTCIECLASKDVDATRVDAKQRHQFGEKMIAAEEAREEAPEKLMSSTPRTKENTDRYLQTLAALEKMPKQLGRTILASGNRPNADRKMLDFHSCKQTMSAAFNSQVCHSESHFQSMYH